MSTCLHVKPCSLPVNMFMCVCVLGRPPPWVVVVSLSSLQRWAFAFLKNCSSSIAEMAPDERTTTNSQVCSFKSSLLVMASGYCASTSAVRSLYLLPFNLLLLPFRFVVEVALCFCLYLNVTPLMHVVNMCLPFVSLMQVGTAR